MRGRLSGTTRRIKRELVDLVKRSPQYKPVQRHVGNVKRTGNAIAKALQLSGFLVDRGLVNQATLAHDSRKDLANHSTETKSYWVKRGGSDFKKILGTDMTWSLRNYPKWNFEKKILAYSDNVCRAVKVGNTYVNGVVPTKIAFKLAISQRRAFPKQVDALIRERQAILKFEEELLSNGINLQAIIEEQMKRNPAGYFEVVKSTIAPDVDKIIEESIKRQHIKKLV